MTIALGHRNFRWITPLFFRLCRINNPDGLAATR